MSCDQPLVLIVDRDPETRDRVGTWLEEVGTEVTVCPGPTSPDFTCVGARDGRCPLAQSADLIVLDLWLASDAEMLGTRSVSLVPYYCSLGKPVVLMTDRRDSVTEWTEDFSLATVDWPPDRRELVETVQVISKVCLPGRTDHDDQRR